MSAAFLGLEVMKDNELMISCKNFRFREIIEMRVRGQQGIGGRIVLDIGLAKNGEVLVFLCCISTLPWQEVSSSEIFIIHDVSRFQRSGRQCA